MYRALPVRNAVSVSAARLTREESQWDVNSYILANVFDAIQQLTHVTVMANSPKGNRPKKPQAHPRPNRRIATANKLNFPGKTVFTEK